MGELFSVLSALFWGLTLISYRKAGEVLPPTSTNLLKNLVSVIFLLPFALLLELVVLLLLLPDDGVVDPD